MDETSLRAQFESAVAARPPTPHLVGNSVRAGRKLRRRRRVEAAAVSVSAVALVAVLAPFVSAQFTGSGHERGDGKGVVQEVVHGRGIAYVWTTINAATSAVTPVRLRTGTALKPVKFGGGVVLAMAAAPDGKAVYIFSTQHRYIRDQVNYVTRITPVTRKESRPVKLRGGLQQIQSAEIAPGGRFAYAIEQGEWPGSRDETSALIAINLATGAQRKLLDGAGAFAMTPDGSMGYAYGIQQEVIPVDLATDTVWRRQGSGPSMAVSIAPDGKPAYVLSAEWVTPIDVATGAAGKSIRVPAGSGPMASELAVAADGKTAYVSGGPSVIPINLASRQVLRPIRLWPNLAESAEFSVVIAPDAGIGYAVPLLKWVQPLDLRTGIAGSQVHLPSNYRTVTAPALDPSGQAAYVGAATYGPGNVEEDAIIPVWISSEQVGKPIRVAGLPVQVVIAR